MNDYIDEYKGKSVLITGGAGCIGSNPIKGVIKMEASKIQYLIKQR
jgi:FlaA1/EpsC-like NDP-sugar epimerase